jgi:hypothetical protein
LKLFITIFILCMLMPAASASRNQPSCAQIKSNIDRLCNKAQLETNCRNLKVCQEIRNHCPQSKETVAGCTDYSACLEERAQSENTIFYCQYKWSGQPNDGLCYLQNPGTEDQSYKCPGHYIRTDRYRDFNFICEGHKERTQDYLTACNSAVEELAAFCPREDSGIDSSLLSCAEINNVVNPTDSEVSPQVSQNGPRNNGYAQPKEEGSYESYNRALPGSNISR